MNGLRRNLETAAHLVSAIHLAQRSGLALSRFYKMEVCDVLHSPPRADEVVE
jgi:hypothetical protein